MLLEHVEYNVEYGEKHYEIANVIITSLLCDAIAFLFCHDRELWPKYNLAFSRLPLHEYVIM